MHGRDYRIQSEQRNGFYEIIYPDEETEKTIYGVYKPNHNFVMSRQLNWYSRDRDEEIAQDSDLLFASMSSTPAKGHVPPHNLLRMRSGEWACEKSNDDKPCCFPMVDDPNPPNQARLLNENGFADTFRGCCVTNSKHVNFTFPFFSSEETNYLLVFWA